MPAKRTDTTIPSQRVEYDDSGIREPLKYGQLRNYLNPIKFPSAKSQSTPYKTRLDRDESHKLTLEQQASVISPLKQSRLNSKQSSSKPPFK